MAGERVDANPGELRQPVDAVVQTPQFEDLGMGVDADAQRAVCAPGGRHARTETHHDSCAFAGGTDSDWIGSDSPDQDCSDRTDTVPARSASMPWTAAASPATVVKIGRASCRERERQKVVTETQKQKEKKISSAKSLGREADSCKHESHTTM